MTTKTITKSQRVYRTYTKKQTFSKQPASNATVYGSTAYSWTDTRTGSTLPGWRQRIARVQDATTTLTGSKKHLLKRYGYIGISYRDNTNGEVSKTFWGDIAYSDPPSTTSISTTIATDKAKTKFVKKALEVQQSLAGTSVLAELTETLHMIRHPFEGIKRFNVDHAWRVKNLLAKDRRLRRVPSKRLLAKGVGDIIAGSWLQKQFGIDPLLSDVDDAAKALAKSRYEIAKEHTVISARGVDESYSLSGVNTHPGAPSYVYSRWRTATVKKAEVIFRAAIQRQTNADHLPDYQEVFGLRARDILPGVWEGIPWSWLIDYTSNVGDIINAYSLQRTDMAWCNQTVRKEAKTKAEWFNDLEQTKRDVAALSGGVFYGSESYAPRFEWTTMDIVRQSYAGTFVPTLVFDIAGINTNKLLNLSAVAWSRRDLLSTVAGLFSRFKK